MENKEYKFKFDGNENVFIMTGNKKLRLIQNGADMIKQSWRMRVDNWGHKKPKVVKTYKMKLEGKFTDRECNDADCPINGCKHAACYFSDYTSDKIAILHGK